MGQTTALTTPGDQVDELMQQVAEENGLELEQNMPGAVSSSLQSNQPVKEKDELGERLAKLRSNNA